MKRIVALIISLIIIIGIPTVLALIITIKRAEFPWYSDSFYYFFVALIAVCTFFASIDRIINFIERFLGPNYPISNKKIAKRILKDLSYEGMRGVDINFLIPWASEKYGQEVTREEIKSICENLIEINLLRKNNDKIIITYEGEIYSKSMF